MVETDDVDPALPDARQAAVRVLCMFDGIAAPLERSSD
jgi:hypothetical protein